MESFFVIHLSLMSECMRMMLSQTFLTFGSSHRTTAFPSLVANVSATAEYNDQNTKHNANTNGNAFQNLFLAAAACAARSSAVVAFTSFLRSQIHGSKSFSVQ